MWDTLGDRGLNEEPKWQKTGEGFVSKWPVLVETSVDDGILLLVGWD
jgi:hypothetical protein